MTTQFTMPIIDRTVRVLGQAWSTASFALLALLLSVNAHAQTTVEYIHTDALGSPVAVTDASGNVIEREVYEPYGSPITHPPSDQPGFTGHVADSLTNLTYMQQRYYDPQIGRFLSVDPVTAYSNPVGAFNRYWYANNNPYRFTDPDGRDASDVWGGFVDGLASNFLMTPSGVQRESLDLTPQPYGGIEGNHQNIGYAVGRGVAEVVTIAVELGTGGAAGAGHAAERQAALRGGAANGPRAGKDHTPAANRLGRELNRAANGGELRCPTCGKQMNEPVQSRKGVPVDRNAAVGDHRIAKAKGGDGATVKDMRNHETKCWACNDKKKDN